MSGKKLRRAGWFLAAMLLGVAGCGENTASNPSSGTTTTTGFSKVEPVISAEESAKRINNRLEGAVRSVNSEKVTIYQPKDSWSYSHGAIITFFEGKFYVMFSNGRENEDDCGQRVMLSTSEDGHVWTQPKPLVDTRMGEHSELVLQGAGFLVAGDKLVAFYGASEYEESKLRGENLRPLEDGRINYKNYALVTTDGENWTDAGVVAHGRGGFGVTRTGRLIAAGPPVFPYTDDSSGTGKYNLAVLDMSNIQARGAKMLTESCFYQTDDGIIHMMFRTDTGYIWASESYDDGASYTEPYPTNFTNDTTKFQFGRLPDGRFFCIGSPVPESGRNMLMLSLSEDGVNFNKQYLLRDEAYTQQFPGLYKGGLYGYPHAIVQGDRMYVVYSKRKEAIEVTSFALSELGS